MRPLVGEGDITTAEISLGQTLEALSYLRRIWHSIEKIRKESRLTMKAISEEFDIARVQFNTDLGQLGLKAIDLQEARTLDDLFRKATKLQWIPSNASKNSEG